MREDPPSPTVKQPAARALLDPDDACLVAVHVVVMHVAGVDDADDADPIAQPRDDPTILPKHPVMIDASGARLNRTKGPRT